MNKNENIKKLIFTIVFILWSTFVLSAFYITQRPLALQIINGLAASLWSISLLIILLFVSAAIGHFTLLRIQPQLLPHERLILGTGFGLGILGLTGFGLGAVGLATLPILSAVLLGVMICSFIFKVHRNIADDMRSLLASFRIEAIDIPKWIPFAILITCLISFLFALLPPADGFDGLLYHLRLPEQMLADGKLLPYNNFPFWFPSLIEGDFLWALALKSERTAQLIHWSFFILTLTLVWNWSREAFGIKPAWFALTIVISMPALPWLASWAYTDLGLTFFSLACIYALARWYEKNEAPWLVISALFAGLAMGVKYTSFILPVACVLLIFFRTGTVKARITACTKFSIVALLTALPWYVRNWLFMGNPVYPFIFGGRYWDSFSTTWYSGIGTGIGWNINQILTLPLTITLGHQDQTFYDGRIGPLFLLLIPFTLWTLWNKRSSSGFERITLFIISIFTACSYFFWVFSITQTIYLWQSRLLFPALIPFSIPIGLAVSQLDVFDLPRFRLGFILNTLIGIVVSIALIDNSLTLIARRPLYSILGIESRQAYFQRIQPNYSDALTLVSKTPPDASIYFLLEPRSYNMPRTVQPDPNNANLPHDYYLYKTPDAIVREWKAKGYTHLLIYKPGIDFFKLNNENVYEAQINDILKDLHMEIDLQNYSLYSIP